MVAAFGSSPRWERGPPSISLYGYKMTSHTNAQPPATPIQILLAEDNPGDVFLIREALREQGLEYELSVVEDGEEAVSCVCREGVYAGGARPDLMLLDLNRPKYGRR